MDSVEDNECMLVEENLEEIREPADGMEFINLDEFQRYYHDYGNKKGFPVKVMTTEKDADGKPKFIQLSCGRSGKQKSRAKNVLGLRGSSKCGCLAKIRGHIRPDGTVLVRRVTLDHNHELSPGKSRFYPKNRTMSSYVKKKLDFNDRAGIRPNKRFSTSVVEGGGPDIFPFFQKDCYNYLDKMRKLRLGEGDAMALHNYFQKMQANNVDFFYMMDLDDEGRLRNVFWADAWNRAAYKEFGDVVTFDTTYLTNKYEMPFAPFVGVNHHGQSILLGCGLICGETVEEFVWLFQTWLVCMNDNAPSAIITDQDRAMKKAIEIVFPNTRHRWCLWHIMKKLPEKLSGCNEYEAIKFAMQRAVYDSLSHDEFEENWRGFIDKYNLHENDWLSGLYLERMRWVPTFQRNTFWAGMSSTQRSESMNVFFDGYVNSKTTLKQFVEQYENALRSKVQKEAEEDFKSYNQRIPCITPYAIEIKFRDAYTTNKFREFQEEIAGNLCCRIVGEVMDGGGFELYTVRQDLVINDRQRSVNFIVSFNVADFAIKCNCQLFEFRGILCKHILKVLFESEIHVIPDKYVLQRWRKDVKRAHTKVKIVYSDWGMKPENVRFEKMCNAFYEMADFAAEDEKKTCQVQEWITLKMEQLKIVDGDECVDSQGYLEVATTTASSGIQIHSSLPVCSKGRRSNSMMESTVEKICKMIPREKKKDTQKDQAIETNLGLQCTPYVTPRESNVMPYVMSRENNVMPRKSNTQDDNTGSHYLQSGRIDHFHSLLSQPPGSSNEMDLQTIGDTH